MAERNPKVMEMVEKALTDDPNVGSPELRRRAAEIDPSIAEMDARRFNALYPLQVKRARGGRGGGGGGRKSARKAAKKAARKAGGGRAATKEAVAAPAKRGRPRGSTGGGGASGGDPREAIRRVLHDFATEIAAAESRAEIARVLGGVDGYVDRLAKLAR